MRTQGKEIRQMLSPKRSELASLGGLKLINFGHFWTFLDYSRRFISTWKYFVNSVFIEWLGQSKLLDSILFTRTCLYFLKAKKHPASTVDFSKATMDKSKFVLIHKQNYRRTITTCFIIHLWPCTKQHICTIFVFSYGHFVLWLLLFLIWFVFVCLCFCFECSPPQSLKWWTHSCYFHIWSITFDERVGAYTHKLWAEFCFTRKELRIPFGMV